MLNKLRDIKLIACDMDGTFLDPEHKIRIQNLNAVSEIRNKGLEFIIVRYRKDVFLRSLSLSFSHSYTMMMMINNHMRVFYEFMKI